MLTSRICKIALFFLTLTVFFVSFPFNSLAGKEQYVNYENRPAITKFSNWETLRNEEGILMTSRWLIFADTIRSREMALIFEVNCFPERIVYHLRHPSSLKLWNDGTRSANTLYQNDSIWITHLTYDIPFPFKKQDIVIKNMQRSSCSLIRIQSASIPDYIPRLPNCYRQYNFGANWTLKRLSDNKTRVWYSAVSLTSTGIPGIIRDPIVQGKLFNSMRLLKELCEANK